MSNPGYFVDKSALVGRKDKRFWSRLLFFVCVLFAGLGLLTPNPMLTAAGVMVPLILFILLWRPGEPPVLFFAASFQWLQVFMPIVNANREGHELGARLWLPEMQTAAWLGLITIIVLAFGMRIGVRRQPPLSQLVYEQSTMGLSPIRLMIAYGLVFVVDFVAEQAAAAVPGLRQQIQALGTLRWVVVFLIGWAALRNPKFRFLAISVFFIELLLGFTGYFSTFKTILFLGIVLILGSRLKLIRLIRPSTIGILIVTIVLVSFWQAIKDDYRYFLSRGQHAQVVLVPMLDRFAFILNRATKIDSDDLIDGFDTGLERLGYLEFFARSINRVPRHIPYQDGRLTKEAILHVLTPRVLFPNKPAINDSERTTEFTGVRVAGVVQGTSVSIGYAGESYIDFGPFFMFVPILLLGMFWGWAYRWLITRTRYRLLGLAVATNIILGNALFFESSNIKLFGGAVTSILVLWLVLKFGGNTIWRFIAPRRS